MKRNSKYEIQINLFNRSVKKSCIVLYTKTVQDKKYQDFDQNDDFRILIGSGRFIDTDFIVAESAIDILRILPNVSTQKHGDIVGKPVIHFANEDSINKNVGDSIDSNDVNAILFADFAIIAEVEEFK